MGTQLKVAWMFLLAGCASLPYQPTPVGVDAQPGSFELVLQTVLAAYPKLVEIDSQAFRIQSDWNACEDLRVPGQRRASIYRDPDDPSKLWLLVEARFFHTPLIGTPGWTKPRGHRMWERELATAIQSAFAD